MVPPTKTRERRRMRTSRRATRTMVGRWRAPPTLGWPRAHAAASPMTVRKSSPRLGSTRSNSRTGPVARAACSSAWSSTPGSSSKSRRAPSARTQAHARHAGLPVRGRRGHVDPAPLAAPGAQLRHRAAGDHPAVVDDAHPVAQPLDELELVAREDDGDPRIGPLAQHLRHDVDGDRVEPGERLVEHEHVGPEDEGRGQLDALLVAQAQRLQLGVAPLGEAEALEPAEGRLAGRRVRHAVQLAEVGQLLRHAHLRVQAAFLGHVADAPAGLEGQGRAQPAHRAGVGGEHAQHDAHRGGLAGAVAAHEAEQLAGADLEASRSCTATVCPYRFEMPSISSARSAIGRSTSLPRSRRPPARSVGRAVLRRSSSMPLVRRRPRRGDAAALEGGSRPASRRARRSRNSIWPLRLRRSSAAQARRAAIVSGSSRSRNGLRSAMAP